MLSFVLKKMAFYLTVFKLMFYQLLCHEVFSY